MGTHTIEKRYMLPRWCNNDVDHDHDNEEPQNCSWKIVHLYLCRGWKCLECMVRGMLRGLGISGLSYFLMVAYMLIGTFIYFFHKHDFAATSTSKRFLDGLYYSVVTLATVGYGDIHPSTTGIKWCAIVFMTFGYGLNSLLNIWMDFPIGRMKEVWRAVSLAFLVLMGIIFIMTLEQHGFVDAVYLVVESMTTVGYGDVSFNQMSGRALALVWIPLVTRFANQVSCDAHGVILKRLIKHMDDDNGVMKKIGNVEESELVEGIVAKEEREEVNQPCTYIVTDVAPDGRCMFRSIAHLNQLNKGKGAPTKEQEIELADRLRAKVVEVLQLRLPRVESALGIAMDDYLEEEKSLSFDSYVNKVKHPLAWGAKLELIAATVVIRKPILVYEPIVNQEERHDEDKEEKTEKLIQRFCFGEEYGRKRANPNPTDAFKREFENEISLWYNGTNHYQVLKFVEM